MRSTGAAASGVPDPSMTASSMSPFWMLLVGRIELVLNESIIWPCTAMMER
jgi:hypothetical protein